MPPVFGRRQKDLDPFELDRTTVRELARDLAHRLEQVEIYGGKCACRNAEAKAFLAKMRRLLGAMGG